MRKVGLLLFITAMMTIISTASVSWADQTDALIEKLVEKGILTESEANEILDEVEKTEAKKDGDEGKKADSGGAQLPDWLPKWVKNTDFYGDLRLRHDTQWRRERDVGETPSEQHRYHRNRERYRLRFGFKYDITDNTKIDIRLASGSGFQNTTNQSFDTHARGKSIFIDRASATWKATDWFTFAGGKQKNPLFTSPLVWDPDVNPEGLTEKFRYTITEGVDVYANFGQWFVEELDLKDVSNTDPTMYTYQVGTKIKPGKPVSIEMGATYYDFTHLDNLYWSDGILDNKTEFLGYSNKYGQQMIFDEDERLLNKFECIELGAKVSVKDVLPVPFSVFGSYIKNNAADSRRLVERGVDPGDSDPMDIRLYRGDNRDKGWQAGLSVGSKKKKGDLYVKYFFQKMEDYAFPAVFVDSDFHNGGTNNKGHYLNVKYLIREHIQLAATGFLTERDDERKDGEKDEERVQLDVIYTLGK